MRPEQSILLTLDPIAGMALADLAKIETLLRTFDPLYRDVTMQRWEKLAGRKTERRSLDAAASA